MFNVEFARTSVDRACPHVILLIFSVRVRVRVRVSYRVRVRV